MKILVINCGSSSLKFQLIETNDQSVLCKGLCERIGIDGSFTYQTNEKVTMEAHFPTHNEAIKKVLDTLIDKNIGIISNLDEIDAVGHRVAHGGSYFNKSTIIDEKTIEAIEACIELAPLHNPANLIGMKVCKQLMPDKINVAVFDTAFHQTMPTKAYLYAIPRKYYDKYQIRRYGFHGTSHSFVSKRVCEISNQDYNNTRTIVCHLGNGASVCAINNGQSVDTTMGFTPIEGLAMGTRCGDIDATILEYLMERENLTINEMIAVLNKESGVLGISNNLSSDFRDLLAGAANGNQAAQDAIDVFAYRVLKAIGSYCAAMNGVDNIVFTAGIGENNAYVRKLICSNLTYLGFEFDDEANEIRGEEIMISKPNGKVKIWVIPTNEELAIALDTENLIQ